MPKARDQREQAAIRPWHDAGAVGLQMTGIAPNAQELQSIRKQLGFPYARGTV